MSSSIATKENASSRSRASGSSAGRAGPGPAEHVDLIFRYHGRMRTITATEASRNFSDLLDAIERGETVTITRGHHVVAEMRPARRRTGADLRTALDDIPPPDERFAADIAGAVALLTSEGTDPWAGA
jgi:antitoxin (DNA-binding transcriptional repressor) of toxin-antitoxin stability system